MDAVRSESDRGRGGRLNVLLTEGEQSWVEQLPRLLQPQGVRAILAPDVDEAVRVIRQGPVHAVLVDMSVPMARVEEDEERDRERFRSESAGSGEGESTGGLKLLRVIRRLEPAPPTVVVRGRRFDRRHDDRLLREALKLEAFSVLDQPVQLEQLLEVLRRLIERHYGGRWPGLLDEPGRDE